MKSMNFPEVTKSFVGSGARLSDSDRVKIIWADGAIANTWLQVIVLAHVSTGLPQKAGYPAGQGDGFFFGSAAGNRVWVTQPRWPR